MPHKLAIVRPPVAEFDDGGHVVLEELLRLPARFRAVLSLCDLEGRPLQEAARLLDCPVGTVKSRIARARERLRVRLRRRGFDPAVSLLAAIPSGPHSAVPVALIESTARLARLLAAGQPRAFAAASSLRVLSLMRKTLALRAVARIKLGALFAISVAAVAGPLAIWAASVNSRQAPPNRPPAVVAAAVQKGAAPLVLDSEGIPLPAGAIRKIGLSRLNPGASVTAVAFHPNGKLLASAGFDRVKLWDRESGRLIHQFPKRLSRSETLSFSNDGSLIASGDEDGLFRVLDTGTGETLHTRQAGGSSGGAFLHTVFHPAAKIVATGAEQVRLWDALTGTMLKQLDPPAERVNWPTSMAFSPDGKTLAIARRRRGEIQLWDIGTGQFITIPGESIWIRDVKFSPDGKTLAWCFTRPMPGETAGGVRFWDVAANEPRGQLPVDFLGQVFAIAFSPDGRELAAADADHRVSVWDVASRKRLRELIGHTAVITSVAFSPDGKTVASGAYDGLIRLWDTDSGEEKLGGPMAHWGSPRTLTITSDGKQALLGCSDSVIRAVELESGKLLNSLDVRPTNAAHRDNLGKEFRSAAISPTALRSRRLGAKLPSRGEA